MSDILLGRNLILSVNGQALAAAKSCQVRIKIDTIEVSSPTSSKGRTYRPGRMEWEITATKFVTSVRLDAGVLGKTVSVSFGLRDDDAATGIAATDNISGQALITQWDCTAAVGNLASGSFRFKGQGDITLSPTS